MPDSNRTVSACTFPPQQAATALSAAEIQEQCTQDESHCIVSYNLPESLLSILVDTMLISGLRLLAAAKNMFIMMVLQIITLTNHLLSQSWRSHRYWSSTLIIS